MPPQYIFDLTGIDFDAVAFDQEAIRQANPQRGHMEQLNRIIWVNKERDEVLGLREIGHGEFWEPGHIPGRPLFPGVLMIEAGAQLASFYTRVFVGWKGFIGFGGVSEVRFRQQVPPGVKMYLLGKLAWNRHRRIHCNIQGVVNGTVVFEAGITGVEF